MLTRDKSTVKASFPVDGKSAPSSVAIHFLRYNFARIHKTLRITPAMAAGIADHVWSMEKIIGLLDAAGKKSA